MVDFNDRRLGRTASPEYGKRAPEEIRPYTKDYQAGWAHSSRASSPSLERNPHPPEDSRYDAWEDGYMDHAVGRDKYALRGHRFGTGDPVEGY